MIKYLPDIYLLKKIGIFARSNNSNNNSCNPIVPCRDCCIDDKNKKIKLWSQVSGTAIYAEQRAMGLIKLIVL